MLLLLLGLLLRTTAASDTRNVLYEYVSEWVLDANISVAAAPRTDICKCFISAAKRRDEKLLCFKEIISTILAVDFP